MLQLDEQQYKQPNYPDLRMFLFPIKSIKDSRLQFQRTAAKEEKRIWQQKEGIFDPDKDFRPNQKPVLPRGAQLPILQHINELTNWGPEKMISWNELYYWKLSPTVSHKVCNRCFIYLKYNPGKSVCKSQGHTPLPLGPFEIY